MSTVTTPRLWRPEIGRALAAELMKLWTLPAIWLVLAGTWAFHLLLSTALAGTETRNSTDSTQMALDGGIVAVSYTQAGFILLGVVAACSEYNGGQIRTTLVVTPRRTMQLITATVARVIVAIPAGAIVATSGVVAIAIAFGSASDLLATSAGTVIGVTCHLMLLTVMGAAAGIMFRRSLPAVGILMGYFFIVGPLLRDQANAATYLPDVAGSAMWSAAASDVDALTPVQGGLVMAAWTFAAVAIAALIHRNRDT